MNRFTIPAKELQAGDIIGGLTVTSVHSGECDMHVVLDESQMFFPHHMQVEVLREQTISIPLTQDEIDFLLAIFYNLSMSCIPNTLLNKINEHASRRNLYSAAGYLNVTRRC